ncbi:polyhydroxyalkanoate synthesis regulator phasin [Microbacteriaceae bacterium SG_E_30_P1]|uniref:Polyhydroxyalkanoate synthesis regulator phasin n=1 Tax=Antiquaquibacter oligotrophicus TaxID=2880260 RepID=A0ABT6KRU6_9MICO|nr:hypothetical protein [Antiquaquibacter oligotrophicus]MDH6181812.1 polyhydroxyalkanoate synthesis regulator phasin [Antiquaquibacter oligotrophicus]UDF12509.1 hypothetical protein LH407_10135 [Antiquaquibacter oligotrophicus]
MAPISIDFLANAKGFLRGADDVEAGLEKVASSLDELAADGKDSNDKIAKSGEAATEKLERSFGDLARSARRDLDNIQDDGRRNFRRFGDAGKSATERVERGMEELKDEAKQSTRETVASFRDVEDVLDLIQEMAANLFVGFGPAGFLAGAAAAVGIGLAGSAIETGTEQAEAYKQRISDLADQFIETGQVGDEWLTFLVQKLRELATETEPGNNLKRLSEIADRGDSSFRSLAQAYAGNGRELDRLIRKEEELKRQLEDQSTAIDTSTNAGAREYEQTIKLIAGKDEYLGKLREAKVAVDSAAEAEALYAQSGGPELERKAELVKLVNDAYDETASSVDDYRNAETGLFDVQAYIDAMNARTTALRDYQNNLATSGLTPEAKSFLNSQGAEAASSFLAGYLSASPEQREELNRIWSEAASENSGTYNTQLTGVFRNSAIVGPSVTLREPDAGAVTSSIQRQFDNRSVTLRVQTVDQYGRVIP